MFSDGHRPATVKAQQTLEKKLTPLLQSVAAASREELKETLRLKRDSHVAYVYRHLGKRLTAACAGLESSQPWIVYWSLQALSLLNASLPDGVSCDDVVEFLKLCQDERGGFGGGPGQIPHLAATYAAVMSLVILGTPNALDAVNRPALEAFLLRMCVDPEKGGGLTVHENGEIDARGCYTAIAVAHVLNLDKHRITEQSGMIGFLRRCQTFEGGLGGEPGNEAHGGYTFCGLAALVLLDRVEVLNTAALLRWAVHMQGSLEGGFMGRTHKLVDGCYSYWQGAVFTLLRNISPREPWTGLGSQSTRGADVLSDLPLYEAEVTEYSAHEEHKDQAEKRLRRRAEELELNLESGLRFLARGSESSSSTESQVRLELFKATFDQCHASLQAADVSFEELFSVGSDRRGDLPIYIRPGRGDHEDLYDAMGLQFWILVHCQVEEGGLRDKPHKHPDLYHTCYCLSGLAIAQQYSGVVLGEKVNELPEIDPVLNVLRRKAEAAKRYFG